MHGMNVLGRSRSVDRSMPGATPEHRQAARRLVRCAILCLAFASWSGAAFAVEPLLLLLRVLRDQAISSSVEAGAAAMRQPAAVPDRNAPQAGYGADLRSEDERLKALIDDSFAYVSPAQRAAVHAGLMDMLSDPRNAAIRPDIVAEFVARAGEVRETYRRLEQLSYAERKRLAATAGERYRRLGENEQRDLRQAMQSGLLPLPRDLSELMLAEFDGAAQ